MRAAAEFIRGARRPRGGARLHPHLAGAVRPVVVGGRPALPPEVVLLPSWVPLNVYDFACWARQTIVALSLVSPPSHRAPFERRAAVPVRGHRRRRGWRQPRRSRCRPAPSGRKNRVRAGQAVAPDGWLRGRLADAPGPCSATTSAGRSGCCAGWRMARAERWVVRRQEADGSWGGIQPPWVYSLMAFHLQGYPLDHPVMRRGLEGVERFMIEDRDDPRSRGAGRPAGGWKRASRPCGTPRLRWWPSAMRAYRTTTRR